ncbi:MAG: zinc ribbon domain-containing protein [Lachnospiraceae bacterium]|nr:zinc ribbon domain-containing protein [Lachnospiraceae bacterium]
MIKTIYSRAISVLLKKPIRLWGISLLYAALSGFIGILGGAVPLVTICLVTPIQIGMLLIYLRGYRGEEIRSTQLLDIFERKDDTLKRVVIGTLWKDLWVFIWALIPIVGFVFAIIRSYQYRLTPYILANEPDVKPTDAYKISKERTQGYVGAMIGADLLPIGLLLAVTLVLGLFGRIRYIGVLFNIANFLIILVFVLFIGLFLGLVGAAFYEEICNPSMTAGGVNLVNCPNCGASVEEGAAFCPKCGFKMTPDNTPVAPIEDKTEAPAEDTPKPEA